MIVLTAERQVQHRTLALMLGANAFMTKPFLPRDLLDEIARLLGTIGERPRERR